MADARGREQLQHGIEHPEARSQHRHHDDIGANHQAVRGTQWRDDRGRGCRHVSQRFRGQQNADAVGCPPERGWISADVAQFHERVMHQRMIDDVKRHGDEILLRVTTL